MINAIEAPPAPLREALANLPGVAAQEGLDPPALSQVVVPASHMKALQFGTSVVVGIRGAGKSFWTAVLSSPTHRRYVGSSVGLSDLRDTSVAVGFSESNASEDFPSKAELGRLLAEGIDPRSIWLAVLLRHVRTRSAKTVPNQATALKILEEVVLPDPIAAERELWRLEQEIAADGGRLLILFDALDRLADDWANTRRLVRAALQWCLACRISRSLRLKFFMRPDLEEDAEIWAFADSSKLRQDRVNLSWRAADLYSVVLQYLANHSVAGQLFREATTKGLGIAWPVRDDVYPLAEELRRDGEKLQLCVEALTGQLMGANAKRGYCFTWIPLHLADARGNGSPRSILLAVKHAAEWTREHRSAHQTALHPQGIQWGVTEASKTRTNEIADDYPWIGTALEALRGLEVPCDMQAFAARWPTPKLAEIRSATIGRLAPRRFGSDPAAPGNAADLVGDLVDLAVLYRTDDGRLNMPDIFRVGAGVKRRGGVRPPPK